jgi:predicted amidohydrolase YtcJ
VVDAVTRRTEGGARSSVSGSPSTRPFARRRRPAPGRTTPWKGTIEPSKVADLCILDGRLDQSRVETLRSRSVAATLLDGEFVHRCAV